MTADRPLTPAAGQGAEAADEHETAAELRRHLPRSIPARERIVALASRHLALLRSANATLNLTAITSARDTVIKHVVDSLLPLGLLTEARLVLDVGSGAGFPGIPLAIACAEKHVVLAESVRKKAAFLTRTVEELGLSNAAVYPGRAEEWLGQSSADAVVIRAVGSTRKLLRLLAPVRSRVGALLLYKGPSGERELAEARRLIARLGLEGDVALRYELPAGRGRRCVLRFAHRS